MSKRSRLDQANDFWDDDFDGDAIEDCFKKAIQSQNDDITLLTSYSIFKEPKPLFTSTQFSQACGSNQIDFEGKIEELKAKYAEKQGEATILRTNLLRMKASCDVDQDKKQVEWNEKLTTVQRESRTVRSELELKNLEVANLKQQIAELSKLANVEQYSTQKAFGKVKKICSPEKDVKVTSGGNPRIYINLTERSGQKLNLAISWLNCLKTIFDLQNNTETEIMTFYNDIANFEMKSDDLKIQENCYLPTVMTRFFQVMKNFHDCLKEIDGECSLQSREKCDRDGNLQFLQNNRITNISLIISKILGLFGEMLSYHSNLRNYFLAEDPTEYQTNEMAAQAATSRFLNELSRIISRIIRAGKERECSIFLSAVVTLLCKLIGSEDSTNLPNYRQPVDEILTDLLLLNHRGLNDLILKIIKFLKLMTRSTTFDFNLCSNKNAESELKKKDFCRFHTFITSVEAVLFNVKKSMPFSDISVNILDLTYNIFRSEKMITRKQGKTVCCVSKLSKVATGIVYNHFLTCRNVNGYKGETLSKNRIDIIRLLIFNAFDLTQKDNVNDVVQFKEIMFRLNDMENTNLKHLEKICLSNEFDTIPKEKFTYVTL